MVPEFKVEVRVLRTQETYSFSDLYARGQMARERAVADTVEPDDDEWSKMPPRSRDVAPCQAASRSNH